MSEQQAPVADYYTYLKWLTQIEGDGDYRCELGNKTSCEWCEGKSRCGDYQSARDAALIAQQREKWERERTQKKNPKGSPDGWCMPQCDFFGDCDAADIRSCKRDARKNARDSAIAAQAREGAIEEIYQHVISYCDPMTEGYLESLRSPGQHQEREPE